MTLPGGDGGFGGGAGAGGDLTAIGLDRVAKGGFGGGNGSPTFGFSSNGGGGGGAGLGGAVFNDARASLTVINSTLAANRAVGGRAGGDNLGTYAGGGSGFGGGVFNRDGTVTVVNSTLAGNLVTDGEGILASAWGSAAGGAIYNLKSNGTAAVSLTNTILAGSLGGNDLFNNNGTVTGNNNLVPTSNGGVPASVITTTADPKLGPLQDNGGATRTFALLSGSPAKNTGTTTGAPTIDQRGVARDARPDLGAFESDGPSAAPGGPYVVAEGRQLTLNGTGSFAASGALTYEWDLNYDGATFHPIVTGATPTIVNPDSFAARTIALRVTKSGLSDLATTTLTVTDVAPELAITGAASTNEGSTYTLNLTASGAGQDVITQWAINWGDGTTQTVPGNPPSVTHVYADGPAQDTITDTATNKDGTFGAGQSIQDTFDGTVLNGWSVEGVGVAGVTRAGTASVANGVVNFSGLASSVTLAGITRPVNVTGDFDLSADFKQLGGVDWRMGILLTFGTTSVVFHDAADAFYSYQLDHFVGGVNPGNTAGHVNHVETLRIRRTGLLFTFSAIQNGVETIVGQQTFVVGDLTGVSLRAWTGGASASATADNFRLLQNIPVAVNNVPPTITRFSVPTMSVEGAPLTVSAAASDPDAASEPLGFAWTVLKNGNPYTTSTSAAFTFTPTDDDPYLVRLTVTDQDGLSSTSEQTVIVTNVAPTLAITGVTSTNEGAAYTLNLTATEPGTDTVAYWTINWGDSVIQRVNGNLSSVTHLYYDPNGQFNNLTALQQAIETFTYVVQDKDCATSTAKVTIAVQYDGDGNGDGIADYLQPNVASVPSGKDGSYLTAVSPAGTALVRARPVAAASALPADATFPLGLVQFNVTNVPVGGATTVTLFLEKDTTFNGYYKFGPTPDNTTPHGYLFDFDGKSVSAITWAVHEGQDGCGLSGALELA